MKVAARLFLGAGIFLGAIFLAYWLMSYEPAGSVLLGVGAPTCFAVGIYLWRVASKAGPVPEDRDASHEDAQGEVVAVPGPSLWPVGVAFGAGTLSAGLVLGAWLATPGIIVLVISIIALTLRGRNYS
jgi:hypothetical protein